MAKVMMSPKYPLHTARMVEGADRKLRHSLMRIRGVLKKEIRANASGRVLQKRSGHLSNSVQATISMRKSGRLITGGRLAVGYSLAVTPYARIQDLGGMAGRNHTAKIPKSGFMRRALTAKKNHIRRELSAFVARLVRR